MKRKLKDRKQRNPIASLLMSKLFSPKRIKSKKKYDRTREKRKTENVHDMEQEFKRSP